MMKDNEKSRKIMTDLYNKEKRTKKEINWLVPLVYAK